MRNVVLIVLDSVRKDIFDQVATRLQSRADIEYKQCRAVSSWSVPSHASLFTGQMPSEHGIHTHSRHYSNVDRDDTFLSQLQNHWKIGVSANVFASESFGFDRMFDEFVSISSNRRFPDGIDSARFGQECAYNGVRKHAAFVKAALEHEHPVHSLLNGAHVIIDDLTKQLPVKKPFDRGARALERSIKNRTAASQEPFFIFTNFMDAHGPLAPVWGFDSSLYDAPPNWKSEDVDWGEEAKKNDSSEIERYVGLYKSAVDYLDRRITRLIDKIEQQTTKPTTFVITADHGENLGGETDEYLFEHSDSSLTEALLHVPALVVNAPDEPDVPTDGYVSHIDFGRLIAELAEGEVPEISREKIAAERIGNNRSDSEEKRMLRCVYHESSKYCWDSDGVTQRYQLDPAAPSWQKLVDDSVSIADLEDEFFVDGIEAAHKRAIQRGSDGAIDQATKQKLQNLGYM